MPIKYDKLIALMKKKGINSYTIKKNNIIGQATFKKIKEGGDIDTRTIAKLCAILECQPGDIMDYVLHRLEYNGKTYYFEYTTPLENVKNKGNAEYWEKGGKHICFSREIETNDTLESVQNKLINFLTTQPGDVISQTPDAKDGE